MLLIRKLGSDKLQTVVNLQEYKKNTHKLSAPLPNINGILCQISKGKYQSIIDGQDAYEQIQIVPEHIECSAVTTPDGNMISMVIQIRDCNAPTTYQALMNYLFSNYIKHWMVVYLDDIVIYSNTLEEHVEHITTILDILKHEKLYLSEGKLCFLCKEMRILGCLMDDVEIWMDPDKMNSVLNWKTPINWNLLRGFIGSVRYLADNIYKVQVSMDMLLAITGDGIPFKQDETEQCAFEVVKCYVHACRDHQ